MASDKLFITKPLAAGPEEAASPAGDTRTITSNPINISANASNIAVIIPIVTWISISLLWILDNFDYLAIRRFEIENIRGSIEDIKSKKTNLI